MGGAVPPLPQCDFTLLYKVVCDVTSSEISSNTVIVVNNDNNNNNNNNNIILIIQCENIILVSKM
jgi:hypothetical protein